MNDSDDHLDKSVTYKTVKFYIQMHYIAFECNLLQTLAEHIVWDITSIKYKKKKRNCHFGLLCMLYIRKRLLLDIE